ncbi:MAG TPA: TraM recognition domain-containing protein [Actinomycetota bacterium]
MSLPVMANPTDAEDLFRALMADVSHWASVRKGSRPAFVVCDEFSSLSGGREAAIHILERGRSFGVPSLLSGQSYASLGTAEQADRIVSAAATMVLFASSTPDELSKLAGSVQTTEAVLQAEDGRWTGRASVTTRARHRVDPNAVRQLQPGQAVIVSGGRAERIQVIRAPQGLTGPRPLAAPPGDPDPGRVPGRLPASRAASWPPAASRHPMPLWCQAAAVAAWEVRCDHAVASL